MPPPGSATVSPLTVSRTSESAVGTSSVASPTSVSPRATRTVSSSLAAAPTIRSARSSAVVSAASSVATQRPSRMTVMPSQTAMVSRILWEMKTTLMPSSTIARIEPKRSSTSCGVRLVVGSSSTRILAPR